MRGFWLVPILLFLISIYCFYRTSIIRKHAIDYAQVGIFILGVVLFAAAIISLVVLHRLNQMD